MKRCVAGDRGAPPESSSRVLPPRSARTRLNTRLEGGAVLYSDSQVIGEEFQHVLAQTNH